VAVFVRDLLTSVYCSFLAQFKFVQIEPARLQNVKTDRFLAITAQNGGLVVTTTTDENETSEFNIHEEDAEIKLESVAFPDSYVGVDDNCKVVVLSDGALVNVLFGVTVVDSSDRDCESVCCNIL
jgi:hypothetical protein